MIKRIPKIENPQEPKVGESRIKYKYLLLPLTLRVEGTDYEEKRWLEIAKIKQVYKENGFSYCDGGGSPTFGWVNDCFCE